MNLLPRLLAFGFGSPLMLGWLAAAAAPILIHLWNRRRYKEVSWAAMEYLLAALRQNSRRIQLEEWLLLAVRTLIVLLAVFAVAEPFLERLGLNLVTGQRTLKMLVLDGSYSMGYKPTDKSLFDRSKQLAEQIVEESSQGDGFTLVLMGSPPSVIFGTPAMEQHDFIEEIKNLKLPHGGGDLPATLTKVEELVGSSAAASFPRKEAYFITDLGRNTWASDLSDEGKAGDAKESKSSAAADFRQRIERLSQEINLVVIDLGQSSGENLAVTGLRLAEPFSTVAREVTFEAQVRNFGTQAKSHYPVEFHVDGRRVSDGFVDVPAGEAAPVSFSYRFETPGNHLVEVRLAPDLLDVDNHRWLSLDVKENVRVLCVDGKPGGAGLSGATDYVVLALNPVDEANASRSVIRPEVAAESSLVERDLARYDCIFLCNVGQFTASEARLLENYLKQGGGLVFFLGDQVLPERYNRELAGENGVRVLPAKLGPIVAEAQYRFDPLDYRSPLVHDFKGREQAGLLTTPIYRYFKLEPIKDSRATVALAFEDGDPAIVEEPLHGGRVFLAALEGSLSSTTPLTKNPWTVMPAWPSFVPLVQEMLALSVGGKLGEHNTVVGQSLGERVPPSAVSDSLAILTPDGRREQLRVQVERDSARWTFADTSFSGVYRLESSGQTPASATAVNVDTTESNLAKLDHAELPSQFSTNRQTNLDADRTGNVARRGGLHKNLLYGLFVLLLAEVFLAWRFGHHRA